MEIGSSWHEWKKVLGEAINVSEFVGMSDDHINYAAFMVGNFLADHFDPANREQRLIKELWDQATEDEKKALASLIARMVDKSAT